MGVEQDEPRETVIGEIAEAWLILIFLPVYLVVWGVRAVWWLFVKREH